MTDSDRIEQLEDRVAVLEGALGFSYNAPPEWGLTPTEERILGILLKCPVAPYERIFAALWGAENDPPDEHLLAVHACRLKRKMRDQGIEVRSMYRFGYWIPAEQKARLADA